MLHIQVKKQQGACLIDVDLTLPSQGVTALFGRSGAGKTSLLELIAGLKRPDQGTMSIDDVLLCDSQKRHYLPVQHRQIGYVFQDARLFPHMTVAKNIAYGAKATAQEVAMINRLLGIETLQARYPASLSGGEQQRVAIARALVTKPKLLLLDEPLASLDEPRKQELLPYLETLANGLSIPIIFVSHDLREVLHLASQMVVLDAGQVIAHGSLQDVWSSSAMQPWFNSQSHSTVIEASALGHNKAYDMTALNLGDNHYLWVKGGGFQQGELVRVLLKSRDISVVREKPAQSSIRNILPVTVQAMTPYEGEMLLTLSCGPSTLYAQVTRWACDDLALKTGDALFAQIKAVSLSAEAFRHVEH
ncbi:Vitamin B12 import ATP-binding protein BtuD [Vibrio stylophorae]|uniref:Vitamin B12 import ATP-binding protein BtuD n=1 Tax=Vibrio stylophorae TaxID=659351 RepID=A0ABM8ZX56_9VIBR|nr:molybdenum ABC transporter ATP-binding protein ModC [Vibrio stylophorae]CAH0535220.1 Vitamin B12 import ATP-binding protein BtuD [Vibrio stylophorae]